MPEQTYRYVFDRGVAFDEVRDTLRLALLAVESLHGRTRVLLGCTFDADSGANAIVIDASTPIGEQLNEIFAGYIDKEFGEGSFVVQKSCSASTTALTTP